MEHQEKPTRCVIVDVDGKAFCDGFVKRTPEASRPHVGKEGLAEFTSEGVRITLDDGTVLWGYECWWRPTEERKEASKGLYGGTPSSGGMNDCTQTRGRHT